MYTLSNSCIFLLGMNSNSCIFIPSIYAVERESLLIHFLALPISHLEPETAVIGYLRAFLSSCSRTSGLYLKLRFKCFISNPLQFITQ